MSKQGLTATVWIAAWTLLALAPQLAVAEKRTEKHQQYGQRIWDYVAGGEKTYTSWATAADAELPDLGPPRSAVRTYFNQTAVSKASAFPYRSAIVIEHLDGDEPTVAGLTVLIRQKSGYRPESDDWYWSHFSPDGRLIKCCVDRDPLDKPGFVTFVNDGRLWVFRLGSGALAEYLAVGEPAKNVTRPAAGPGGMTLRSDDNTTLDAYGAAQEGFVTEIVDGRIWVFRPNSEALAEFRSVGEPAKHVTRPGAGPSGMTVRGPDVETIDAYLAAKPGFDVRAVDGRLWVFKSGCEHLVQFEAVGEPAKHVTRPGVGPQGQTVKSPDAETIDEYTVAQAGYETVIDDGRLWVFRAGSEEATEYHEVGEPAKHVTRPGAGPLGMTIKAPDTDTLDSYLRRVDK